ncbi:WD repeat-containing protein 62 [Eudromia elegans]
MAAAAGGAHGRAGTDSPPLFSLRRRSRHQGPEDAVVLERVLGITTATSSGLACDPVSGNVAYPAGCVVVILDPQRNTQRHILNTSRKTLSALAFSPDGKLLATGEVIPAPFPLGFPWEALLAGASRVPGVPVRVPGVAVSAPGVAVRIPAVPVSVPGAPVSVPGAPVSAPGVAVSAPGVPVSVPGVPVSAPGVAVSAPSILVSAPGAPVSIPGVPVSAPGVPVSVPGVAVSAPGVAVSVPGAPVSVPGVAHGPRPAVRVWAAAERAPLGALHGHRHGVACVAFAPAAALLVSVGHEHDGSVNVWDWKRATLVASNKVSCKVSALAFPEATHFVTAGQRHLKFWALPPSRDPKAPEPVPLAGRSGLLGELRDNEFCGAAGTGAGTTVCVARAGLLCCLDAKRGLRRSLPLKVPQANCVCAGGDFVFCGGAGGSVRAFLARDLRHVGDLPKPRGPGARPPARRSDWEYPDAIALAYDPRRSWLSCVYRDHSIYVWDVRDIGRVRRVCSELFHSSFVWSVEVYPDLEEPKSCLPPGSFLTCSSDNTIRTWNLGSESSPGNACSTSLLNVVYVDNTPQHPPDPGYAPERGENISFPDSKSGVRVLRISPDGRYLASGDRGGTLRIHELRFMQEVAKVEAHDSEVLCLEYSKPETGVALLASASRDRLIHVLNVDKNYRLEQTLDDHSSAITSVKFAGNGQVQLISCGADKSIYFRHAQQLADGMSFARTHHVAEKTTLYDMDVDITQRYVAVACQDRNVRIYHAATGKPKGCYKGSQGEDGALLKVQLDPSGTFLATSCSDKSISVLDFHSGECVAKMFGHSEIVTGMRFTYDCKRLITVSGDSCVFIWHLAPEITARMRQHLLELEQLLPREAERPPRSRRETYVAIPSGTGVLGEPSDEESDEEAASLQTPSKEDAEPAPTCLLTNGKLPMWAKRLLGEADNADNAGLNPRMSYRPQGRWAERAEENPIRTLLEADLVSFTPIKSEFQDDLEPRNLDRLLSETETSPGSVIEDFQHPEFFSGDEASRELESLDATGTSLEEETCSRESSLEGSRNRPTELPLQPVYPKDPENIPEKSPSAALPGISTTHQQLEDDSDGDAEAEKATEIPNPAGSLPQTPEQEKFLKQHFETLADAEEKFDGSLKDLKPPEAGEEEKSLFLNPRLSISARFLSRCQKNSRLAAAFLPRTRPMPPADIPEPGKDNTGVAQELGKSEELPEKNPQEAVGRTDAAPCKSTETLAWSFQEKLQLLRATFRELLQLYDQLSQVGNVAEAELEQLRAALTGTFTGMQAELQLRGGCGSGRSDAATGTDAPVPPDAETLALLRSYSEALLRMVRLRLREPGPP